MLKRLTVFTAVLALLTVSGIALAADDEKDDTVFNFGYDEESQVLVWSMNAVDGVYDCTLASGPLTTTYGISTDGLVYVDGLTDGSEIVSFPATPEEDLAEGLIAASGPVDYSGADGDCGLSGGEVAGPNGQVNHGMFMKLFNSLFEGPGRGCVNRYLAQSDLGKGEQQVQVSDVDPAQPELADGATGTVEFESVLADCVRGNQDKVTGPEKAAEKAEQKAEKRVEKSEQKAEKQQAKAEKTRGNSDSAPGRNK